MVSGSVRGPVPARSHLATIDVAEISLASLRSRALAISLDARFHPAKPKMLPAGPVGLRRIFHLLVVTDTLSLRLEKEDELLLESGHRRRVASPSGQSGTYGL